MKAVSTETRGSSGFPLTHCRFRSHPDTVPKVNRTPAGTIFRPGPARSESATHRGRSEAGGYAGCDRPGEAPGSHENRPDFVRTCPSAHLNPDVFLKQRYDLETQLATRGLKRGNAACDEAIVQLNVSQLEGHRGSAKGSASRRIGPHVLRAGPNRVADQLNQPIRLPSTPGCSDCAAARGSPRLVILVDYNNKTIDQCRNLRSQGRSSYSRFRSPECIPCMVKMNYCHPSFRCGWSFRRSATIRLSSGRTDTRCSSISNRLCSPKRSSVKPGLCGHGLRRLRA